LKNNGEPNECLQSFRIKLGVKRVLIDFAKNDADGTIARKPGSGRPKSVGTVQNIRRASELICSQKDNAQSHKSPREIERETGISRRTVQRIIVKQDLQLQTYKRVIGQVIKLQIKTPATKSTIT